MEHNELDKLFRNMIQKDDSGLSNKEQASKAKIWNQLDLPSKSKSISFPFWKIAAAILLLLLAGSSWMMRNNIGAQQAKYTELEEEYMQIKKSLLAVEEKLNQVELLSSKETINVAPSATVVEHDERITQKEYVDRFVTVRDTVWIEKNIETRGDIKLVRDTIYIEVEAESPAKWTSLESNPKKSKDSVSKKKRPSKVEFVFGKKDLQQPKQKQNIFLLESEVVQKNKKDKKRNRIISTPNN